MSETIAKLTELIASSNGKQSDTGIQSEYKTLLESHIKEKSVLVSVSLNDIFISIGEKYSM